MNVSVYGKQLLDRRENEGPGTYTVNDTDFA